MPNVGLRSDSKGKRPFLENSRFLFIIYHEYFLGFD